MGLIDAIEERESAVAKRRRLNGQTKSTQPPLLRHLIENVALPKLNHDSEPKQEVSDESASSGQDDTNSFEALAANGMVKFHSVQNVSLVNERAIKVSITQAQKCLVVGRFFVWVRLGVIRLSGATLDASGPIRRVFHPEHEDVPTIYCLSEAAEIQIESDDSDLTGPSISYSWRLPDADVTCHLTFVLDGMQAVSPSQDPPFYRFRELTPAPLKDILRVLAERTSWETRGQQRLVLCGRRFYGCDATTISLVNHLLTQRTSESRLANESGVLLLDLDHHTSTLTPPGTVSVIRFLEPVLRGHHVALANECRVLAMQFFGSFENGILNKLKFGPVMEALQTALVELPHCPLVVKAWDLVDCLDYDEVQHFGRSIPASNVLVFESDDHAESMPAQSFSSRGVSVHRVVTTGYSVPQVSRSYRARLRTYSAQILSTRSYGLLSNTFAAQRMIELKYGADREIAHILAVHFDEEEMRSTSYLDRLLGTMVAIMLEPHDMATAHATSEQEASVPNPSNSENTSSTGRRGERHVFTRLEHASLGGLPVVPNSGPSARPLVLGYECIGLGVVTQILVDQHTLRLVTPVHEDDFCVWLNQDRKFHLQTITP